TPAPSTPDTSTLSLHDALPICMPMPITRQTRPVTSETSRTEFAASATIIDDSVTPNPVRLTMLTRICAPASNTPIITSALPASRSEEHTSELQSRENLVCRLLL